MSTPSLAMIPSGYKTAKLYSILPTDGTGEFTFAGSAVDRINSAGVSETVATNEPRLDYQGEYVAPTDNSYYDFNGTSDYLKINSSNNIRVSNRITHIIEGVFVAPASDSHISTVEIEYSMQLNSSGKIRFGIFASSTWQFSNYSSINVCDGNKHHIAGVYDGTNLMVYIDGVIDVTTLNAGLSTSTTINDYYFATNQFFSAFIDSQGYKIELWNIALSASEVSDRYNGVAIATKYIGVNNVSKTVGSIVVGNYYRINTIGTTDFTLIGASSNTGGLEFIATGVGTGTGTVTRLGNTLLLDGGKTASNWYDKTHALTGVVTGATLVNSNNFTNEVHPITTCPKLRLNGNITNSFLNSATPVTQTVTTVIGTTYTISCNGVGLLTVAETGGDGRGGVVTEVDHFTYIATTTSMVVTVVTAPNNVNFTNTSVPVRHIPTLGTSVTKVKDQITQEDISAYATNNFEIYLEQEIFNPSESLNTLKLTDGTDYVAIYNNVLDLNGVSLALPTQKNKIIIQNNASNIVAYVNGALFLTGTRKTTTLDTLDLTLDSPAIQDNHKLFYNDANNLSTASEMITKTT